MNHSMNGVVFLRNFFKGRIKDYEKSRRHHEMGKYKGAHIPAFGKL